MINEHADAEYYIRKYLSEIGATDIDFNGKPAEDSKNYRPDFPLFFSLPTKSINLPCYKVEVKTNFEPRFIEQLGFNDGHLLLVAPFISTKSAEELEKKKISFIDFLGNGLILSEGVYIKTRVTDENQYIKRNMISAFNRKAVVSSRVLRHLLKHPFRFYRIQELMAEAHCSQGQIAKIKEFLKRNDLVEEGENGFRISDSVELLKKWAKEYQKTKEETVRFFSTKELSKLEEEISKYFYALEEDGQYSFCGYTASNIYYHTLRNNKMTLYVSRGWIQSLANELGLKEVEKGANVEITIPYAQAILDDAIITEGKKVVSRAQICLELYGTGGRSEEALDLIFKDFTDHGK